jgi:hypothetical protein
VQVLNVGVTRSFPTSRGNVRLLRGEPRILPDALAEELMGTVNLLFEKIIPDEAVPLAPKPILPAEMTAPPDYRLMPINALRRLAAMRGLHGASRLTKTELIKRLEGLNNGQ